MSPVLQSGRFLSFVVQHIAGEGKGKGQDWIGPKVMRDWSYGAGAAGADASGTSAVDGQGAPALVPGVPAQSPAGLFRR
jgi:hypothetical protein